MSTQTIAEAYKYCQICGKPNPNPGAIPFKCEHCDFAAFFGPVAAVGGILVDSQQRALLVRRARDPGKGKWGLPGGFVDPDEEIETALLREIKEEIGLDVDHCEYLMSFPNQYNYHGIVAPVIDLFYVCHVEGTPEITLAPDELEHFVWDHPQTEHLENMAFHSNRVAIERWLSQAAE